MKKLLVLVAVISILPGNGFARDFKLFVGANAGVSGIILSSAAKDATHDDNGVTIMDLPTSFFGLGADFGMVFVQRGIYSYGATAAFDYMFDSSADISTTYKSIVSKTKVGFSVFSATFDNYLRIYEKADIRQDVVLGLGLANIHERLQMTPTANGITNYGMRDVDETDDGIAIAFKAAYNVRIGNHEGYISGRYFLPVDGDNDRDIDGLFNLNIGLRYLF